MMAPFTSTYTSRLSRYAVLFLMLILVGPARASFPAATGPGGSTPSLGQALNPDGTLRAGTSGSFDARAFRMDTAPNGRPVFRPAKAARVAGAGDSKWQDGFGMPGTNGAVTVTAIAPNGDLYIGGQFSVAGTAAASRIAKWDGSTWSSLGTGLNDAVGDIVVSGTDVYVAGNFTTAGGVLANRVAKWNGTAWSALGTGLNNSVSDLAVNGTDVYVAGGFTTAGGVAANYVAKWNGVSWESLGTGTANGTGSSVIALAVSNTGTVYVGGQFTQAGGQAISYLAQWDGSTWSNVGTGVGGSGYRDVTALAISAAGDLYASGIFTQIGGVAVNYIARWDGAAWSALGAGLSSPARKFFMPATGEVYVVGQFASAGGQTVDGIAHWNGTWAGVATGLPGINRNALAVSGSNVYLGGDFISVAGKPATRIAVWNGTTWGAMGEGLQVGAKALAVAGSTVYAAYVFNSPNPVHYIVQWNGTAWVPVGGAFNGYVHALKLDANGQLYAGGAFTQIGGQPISYVARWDGSTWNALGASVTGTVNSLALDGANLYVGGSFAYAGGAPGVPGSVFSAGVAVWNTSTATWAGMGGGVQGQVKALAAGGGRVYVGGGITSSNGQARNRVARWNGSTWEAMGAGVSTSTGTGYSIIESMAAASNGDLYVGGVFNTAGTGAANNIAKWTHSASSWSALGTGTADSETIISLAVSGSSVYAGGFFSQIGGVAARSIAKWNGTAWSPLGSGLAGNPLTIVPAPDNKLYVGGSFATVGDGSKATAYLGVYTDVPAPTLTSFTPGTGPVGQSVILTGTNFTTGTTVAFNGIAAPGAVVNSATQITVPVPALATTGPISVVALGGSATSASNFTVTVSPLVVTGVSVPPAQNYKLGETLTFTVTFDGAVTATSSPTLNFVAGPATRAAALSGGNGTATLTFTYTVAATDLDLDGIALAAASALSGGSIVGSSSGVAANRALNGVPATSGIRVDGIPPYVAASTRLLPATTNANGPNVTFRVVFNEAVTGVATTSFTVVSTGGVGGTVTGVVPVAASNGTTYDVALTGINGDGSVRLAPPGVGSPIQDAFTNAYLASASVVGETYTIVPGNLLVSTPQTVTGTYANVTVAPGGAATITGNLTVTTAVSVQSGGSFWFGPGSGSFRRGTAAGAPCSVVSGAGNFVVEAGATLGICDPSGISLSGAAGAVQVTGTRSFSGQAHYIYNGDVAQTTGDGLPATVAGLTIGNTAGVTLTNAATSIAGFLNLANGDLTVPAAKTLTINSGATATTGSYVVGGAGSFVLRSGGLLKTANAAGISALGTATGAVQTATARTFEPGASYEYNGPAAQATGTGLPATIAGLTVDNAAGATLTNDLTATGTLAMATGVLATGTRTITLAPTATLAEQETSYVLGQVAANRPLTPGTAEAFGGLGLTLAPAAGSAAPGTTLVTRTTGTALTGVGTSQGILRRFNIEPTVNTGLNVTMSFAYFTHELNGIPAASLALFKSESGSAPWVPQYGTTAGPNVVTKTGIADFSVWTLGNRANPLPVELTTFTATPQGPQAVRLAWTTASERNSAAFEVERSTNGHTFARLGTRTAAGSSSSPRHYELLDTSLPTPQSTIYYRLRQLDKDGTFSYSPVRTVALQGATAGLALYPNPATTSATLTGALPGAAVTVADALGRAVASALADAAGTAVLALPAGLPSGVYVVRSGTRALRLTVE